MAEEESVVSESSVTMVDQTVEAAPNALETQTSNEATVESNSQGGTESTCNNINKNGESSALTSDGDEEKSLEFAADLTEKGAKALKDSDYGEAVECFSRALEIRVSHYGELSPECLNAYYQYGLALLYKAQEESDPLGSVPKKDGESKQDSDKDESVKNATIEESSTASVCGNTKEDGKPDSKCQEAAADVASGVKDQEEGDDESDDEDLAEADEDESDLDLAWKMLDVARVIADKNSGDTMDKVDVLSALAEVALEREDIETSLHDYLKALSILERLVEPDSRHIAELYPFRV